MSGRRNGFRNPDDELDAFSGNASGNTTAATANADAGDWLSDIVDFTDVNENLADQFPLLSPGTYEGEVVECTYGISKQGAGNPMWTWQIRVISPETNRPFNLRYWTMLTQDKKAAVKRDIMRVAPDIELAGANLKELPAMFKRRKVRVKVGVQNDTREGKQGLKQNNVRELLPASDNADNFSDFLG